MPARALAAAVALGAAAAGASELRGRVVDELGSRIPGAVVVLAADGLPAERLVSGPQGDFAFRDLAPASYALAVAVDGFLTLRVDPLEIGAREVVELEIVFSSEHLVFGDRRGEVGVFPEIRRSVGATDPGSEGGESSRSTRLRVAGLVFDQPPGFAVAMPPEGGPGDLLLDLVDTTGPNSEEGEEPRIRLIRFADSRAEMMRELVREEHSRSAGLRSYWLLPGFPGPYGDEQHFALVPVDGGWLLGLAGPKVGPDGTETGYDAVIEAVVRTLANDSDPEVDDR